jgi:hypothetical protein
VLDEVGGQDPNPRVALHLLEEKCDFDVRVAAVGVANLRALVERLVRPRRGTARPLGPSASRTPAEVRLGLAMYVLTTAVRSLAQRPSELAAVRMRRMAV